MCVLITLSYIFANIFSSECKYLISVNYGRNPFKFFSGGNDFVVLILIVSKLWQSKDRKNRNFLYPHGRFSQPSHIYIDIDNCYSVLCMYTYTYIHMCSTSLHVNTYFKNLAGGSALDLVNITHVVQCRAER